MEESLPSIVLNVTSDDGLVSAGQLDMPAILAPPFFCYRLSDTKLLFLCVPLFVLGIAIMVVMRDSVGWLQVAQRHESAFLC